ncbi:hypothetical protein [Chamaesiphon polymorphus]|uniref:Uncharacterized protein n=1 Tax=Chamaesiphon polymorphus CCALA 037 TaxID=2107692 RepID=A0A2T1FH24_9CYAN|nr:hypothetical protein [Chamaesiphon polymorphus]PSB44264.1 hypothetical protein C7B77_25735 [Chamaesiphon polymorphus CCALA 037]
MMNPFKFVSNSIAIVLTCVFVGWLGLTIFKLGASAERNPFLKPIAHSLLGIEEQKDDNDWLSKAGGLLNGSGDRQQPERCPSR